MHFIGVPLAVERVTGVGCSIAPAVKFCGMMLRDAPVSTMNFTFVAPSCAATSKTGGFPGVEGIRLTSFPNYY